MGYLAGSDPYLQILFPANGLNVALRRIPLPRVFHKSMYIWCLLCWHVRRSAPAGSSRTRESHALCVSFEQMLGAPPAGHVLAVAGSRTFFVGEDHIRADGRTRSNSCMSESRSNTDKTKRKPWLTPAQQVEHLKSKGVRFEKISGGEACAFLERNITSFVFARMGRVLRK